MNASTENGAAPLKKRSRIILGAAVLVAMLAITSVVTVCMRDNTSTITDTSTHNVPTYKPQKEQTRQLVSIPYLIPMSPHIVNANIKNQILQNADLRTFIMAGWKVVYDYGYGHPTLSSELDAIYNTYDKNRVVCVCGMPATGYTITLAGCGLVGQVFLQTTSTSTANQYGNAFWYFVAASSFGFSDSASITLSSADVASGANRLSWHSNGAGGYRVGDTTGLNSDNSWQKIILLAPL